MVQIAIFAVIAIIALVARYFGSVKLFCKLMLAFIVSIFLGLVLLPSSTDSKEFVKQENVSIAESADSVDFETFAAMFMLPVTTTSVIDTLEADTNVTELPTHKKTEYVRSPLRDPPEDPKPHDTS